MSFEVNPKKRNIVRLVQVDSVGAVFINGARVYNVTKTTFENVDGVMMSTITFPAVLGSGHPHASDERGWLPLTVTPGGVK